MVQYLLRRGGTVCFASCTNIHRRCSLPHDPLPAGGIEPQRGEEPRLHPPWSPPTTTESTLGTCRGLSTKQDCNPQRPECASVLTRSPRGPQISRGLDLGATHGERARRPVALLFRCVSLDNLDKDVWDAAANMPNKISTQRCMYATLKSAAKYELGTTAVDEVCVVGFPVTRPGLISFARRW